MGDIADEHADMYAELFGSPRVRAPRGIVCNRCGAKNLQWSKVGGWHLIHFDGTKHVCHADKIPEAARKLLS